jgi:hypothetical protein
MSDEQKAVSVEALFSRLSDIRRLIHELPTEEVDKSRRDLLIASMIGLVVSVTGAVPTKIEAIGVEFTKVEQRYFFVFIFLVVLYFAFKYQLKLGQHVMRHWILDDEEHFLLERVGEKHPRRSERFNKFHQSIGVMHRIQNGLPLCLGALSMAASLWAAIAGQSIAQQALPLPTFNYPNS